MEAGAAVILPSRELDGPRLLSEIRALLSDPERLRAMGQAALTLATPNAARDLADAVLGLARTSRSVLLIYGKITGHCDSDQHKTGERSRKHSVSECIHFVGIGGAGMSGMARILARQGVRVTGSDPRESATLESLRREVGHLGLRRA